MKQPRIVYTRHTRHMVKRNPITILMPIITLLAFLWLAWHSQQAQGYPLTDIEAVNQLAVQDDDYLTQLEVKLYAK